jgi:glucosylceramidase
LIVLNNSRERQPFNISHQGKLVTSALNSNAVGTFVW